MSQSETPLTSRREFLKQGGQLAAVSALAGIALPHVHAAESHTIQVGLVGAGGRGTGAAADALSTANLGPIKLVAMADVFEDKLNRSYESLKKKCGDQFDVPPERKFLGFDGYKKVMDCLKPGDVVISATPLAFRGLHLEYAIQKGLHAFMEKPLTSDGPSTRKLFQLADEADKKKLKVGVGLMIRHCRGRQELYKRIKAGQIGEITMMRAYRMHPGVGTVFSKPKPADTAEVPFQIRHFHAFLWASGGLFSDFNIHQIDETCWMKNAWPVKAHGIGGRHYRGDCIDQNFDNYAVEYTFPDGTKLFFGSRCVQGAYSEFASFVHGTRGSAVVSTAAHTPGKVRIYRGHNMEKQKPIWAFPQPEKSPYPLEWQDLITAIRKNQPYNEVKRGAIASLVTSMGRMAAHTGQVITYEQMLNSDHEFAPNVDKLTMDGPAPVAPGADGKYPIPEPGIKKTREY
ncbi:MAG: Gfo/Idh/MocA family oxidoreductase [Verrucomicrobia bacterium]|nr:Gfo/Idh/MocA family oxidoreductase [Verrucomicrobiota bacterium]